MAGNREHIDMSARSRVSRPCWSYQGDTGPDHWSALHPDWGACANQSGEQSPIVLPSLQSSADAQALRLAYHEVQARPSDNSHAIQFDVDPGCVLTLGDRPYLLRQFHFHTPGEHHWDAAPAPAELHLVHKSESGGILIVGVALRFPASGDTVLPLWDRLQQAGPLRLNPSDLMPLGIYLHYRGSLTTPPCTEGVIWLVAAESLAINEQTRDWMRERVGANARPVQHSGLDGDVSRRDFQYWRLDSR